MKIPIVSAQRICTDYDVTHVLIYSYNIKDGMHQVLTYGTTDVNAGQIAEYGNKLKNNMGFLDKDCKSIPLEKCCGNCQFFKTSIHKTYGFCMAEPLKIDREINDIACRYYTISSKF